MGKVKSIRYRMCRHLEEQIQLGTSKREDKERNFQETGVRKATYIHGQVTARTYFQHVGQFGDWLVSKGMAHCTMEEAQKMVPEYITHFPSAFSQKTVRSALARVFDCKGAELCGVRERRAEDIKRGRTPTKRTDAIERRYPREVEICRSTGVRFGRELWQIQPRNLFHDSNGNLYLHVTGKGGKERDILVLGSGKEILEADLASGKYGQCDQMVHLPSHAPVHRLRADYAHRALTYAKEHGYSNGRLYRSASGTYDKGCLAFASRMLGHGPSRYSTICINYLSYGR